MLFSLCRLDVNSMWFWLFRILDVKTPARCRFCNFINVSWIELNKFNSLIFFPTTHAMIIIELINLHHVSDLDHHWVTFTAPQRVTCHHRIFSGFFFALATTACALRNNVLSVWTKQIANFQLFHYVWSPQRDINWGNEIKGIRLFWLRLRVENCYRF